MSPAKTMRFHVGMRTLGTRGTAPAVRFVARRPGSKSRANHTAQVGDDG